jgi:hypothetical protein
MDDLDRIFRRLVQNLRGKYQQYLSTPFSTEELYQVIVPYRHNRQELGIDTNQDYEMALMRLLSGERGYLVVDRDMREALTRELESSNPDTSLFRAFNDRSVTVSSDAMAMLDPASRTSDDARMAAPPPPTPRAPANPPPRASASSRSSAMNPPASRARSGGLGTPPSPALSAAIPIPGMPLPPAPVAPPRQASPQSSGFTPPETIAAPPPPKPSIAPPRAASSPMASNPAGTRPLGSQGHGPAASAGGFTGFRGGLTNSPASDMASTRRSITAAAVGGRCRYCSGTLPDGRQLTFCPHCGQDLTVQQCPACSTELELGWKFCTTCGRGVAQS